MNKRIVRKFSGRNFLRRKSKNKSLGIPEYTSVYRSIPSENRDKEFAEKVHLLIHSVRLIPNYKSTEFEKKVSRLVLEHFVSCSECLEIKKQIESQPTKKGFFKKLGDLADAG